MAKNDNPHSIRLTESIRTVVNEDAAKAFEEKLPLSKAADITKKFEWAKETCDYMAEHYDDATIREIRSHCVCNDGSSTANKMIKYIGQTNSIAEFVDTFNAKENFASLEYVNDHKILFCYPQCYCSCVKRVDQLLPKTWCYCTLAYAKGLFQKVFNRDVEVELLESVKSGDKRCAVSVAW